jgi:PadR family transcriptional regulator AphA
VSTARVSIADLDDDADALSPAQYAVLGLLHEAPAHGYQLQRHFTADGELGVVLPLEQASLYGTLKDLAGRGLIVGSEQREGLRPPRTVYALTEVGTRALDAWLKVPVERLRRIRLDFLLKVYFMRAHGRRALRALVDAQVAACEEYLAGLEQKAGALSQDDFAYLVMESRTSAARSTLEWLHAYRGRL